MRETHGSSVHTGRTQGGKPRVRENLVCSARPLSEKNKERSLLHCRCQRLDCGCADRAYRSTSDMLEEDAWLVHGTTSHAPASSRPVRGACG